ncbi:hypothetical protein GJW-30_1_02141 [Variibacter gotjawalensis]|uniref:Amine oxidase domain-containing protein n=1 Tax=Variibacter gotjawalensis TaxID=1333996 RepID=A0A0S3PUK8_9BRAD|nr:hydroxysqualene dehydroxylase HpnE [Variibacter gotjawalensis]NIK49934.1 squalene-associated FAD-dependent desaturase [Variibacter gotjawalensis]RZS45933.1 squalene-associated FAD-dependent desaturase [Variibacter gotjawalensis]BAT59608.1 hypothetical protein GJW-30_1_02141 [Variibacter gotjawalensis]
MPSTVHIIGAGLAGLAAAIRLQENGYRTIVHEATGHVGGRCRSFYDAATDLVIDNGNHLLLSANHAVLEYARTLGTEDRLSGPAKPDFDFYDLKSNLHWKLRISPGRIPWWVFDPKSRVPGTTTVDYLKLVPLLMSSSDKPLADVIPTSGVLYERLIQPLMLAALNVDPKTGSSALAAQVVRETLAAGGQQCRPLIASTGLSDVLIEPAVARITEGHGEVRMRHELRRILHEGDRATALDFGENTILLEGDDAVVVAVPAYAAATLIPGLNVPTDMRPILNVHFAIKPPKGVSQLIGVVNATTEWIFAFPNRLSVTVSGAERLMAEPREQLAEAIWQEVAAVTGLTGTPMPRWQIVRERRATFASIPAENAKRPGTATRWKNVALAGDFTQTGLPATLEGATRSGNRAADLLMSR